MGLDTSHDCWHGPYSSFNELRAAIASAANEHYGYVPDYTIHPARAYQGWWDDDHPFNDVLDVLFVHSDCDGYIFPQHARPLADRLEPLILLVDENGPIWQFTHRAKLTQFIAGLRKAADEWQIVEFH